MNQAENSWRRNQTENQSNLWKVFEFAINVCKRWVRKLDLGPHNRSLGLLRGQRHGLQKVHGSRERMVLWIVCGECSSFKLELSLHYPQGIGVQKNLPRVSREFASWVPWLSTAGHQVHPWAKQGISFKYKECAEQDEAFSCPLRHRITAPGWGPENLARRRDMFEVWEWGVQACFPSPPNPLDSPILFLSLLSATSLRHT